MESRSATYFGGCVAVVASSLVFVAPAFVNVPVPWYYPLSRAWAIEVAPTGFALDWYGRTLWALLTLILSFAVGRLIARRLPGASPRWYRMCAAWAAMASVLAIAVYTYQLARRHPVPEPLPPTYEPR